jgi:hypothetical protein
MSRNELHDRMLKVIALKQQESQLTDDLALTNPAPTYKHGAGRASMTRKPKRG